MAPRPSEGPTVLVLGATGIIGRELCSAATQGGYEVYAVSRGFRQGTSSLPTVGIRHLVADVYDSVSLSSALAGMHFDVVIDLLSFSPEQLERTLAALASRCEQYVFVSSATVYASASLPDRLTERSERVRGPWSYPARKLDCEDSLQRLCHQLGQQYTIVRPYITYSDQRLAFGAWETDSMLCRLLGGRPVVIGDELADTVTSLTHSRDLAQGIVGLMGNPAAVDEDFHIASEQLVTWREVYEIAARAADVRLNLVNSSISDVLQVFPELRGKLSDRVLCRAFDNSKFLDAVPGFEFQYTVERGYREAIAGRMIEGIGLDARTTGRLDRLVIGSTNSPGAKCDIVSFSRELRSKSLSCYVHYLTGRYSALSNIRRWAGVLVSRDAGPSNYGIGP